jgi:putative membrane protein
MASWYARLMEPVPRQPRQSPAHTLGRRFLKELVWSWLSNIVALFVAALIFSGVDYEGEFWVLVVAGLVFGLVNAVVRPLVIFLTLPAVILSLGIALLFVNALMLWLTDLIVGPFEVSGFWTAVGAAIIVWLVNWALAALLRRPERRGKTEIIVRR